MNVYVGEIRMLAGRVIPANWLICDGREVSQTKYKMLYSVIGTTYGGGTGTFALPDLRGRVPVGEGTYPALSTRQLGQTGGSETVELLVSQMPTHSHTAHAGSASANSTDPTNRYYASGATLFTSSSDGSRFAADALSAFGENAAHENMQPYLAINFIICAVGLWPDLV
jgi:microcystin-dependent protein